MQQYLSRYCTTSKTKPTVHGCPAQQDVWHLVAGQAHKSRTTTPQKKATPAHSGRPVQQDVWHLVAVSSSQEQDDCATKENRDTVASLPEWDEDCSEVTCE